MTWASDGFMDTLADRMAWGRMRMSPVDLLDVTGLHLYLPDERPLAGHELDGAVQPGRDDPPALHQRLDHDQLRRAHSGAGHGGGHGRRQGGAAGVRARISHRRGRDLRCAGAAEGGRAFTIFAESLDRSGYTRGTLSPEPGMEAPVPALRPRPVRRLEDIGMGGMDDSVFGGMEPTR